MSAEKPQLQHTFGEYLGWLREPDRQVDDEAASKIQKAFRTFINLRIYKYYRDLVSFRHRGDPGLLLRCINPHEASLVSDRASGAVVRFRLGGVNFPPVVYYKIFLRGSVTDLGTFAPRDYTVGKPGQFYTLQRHNTESLDEFKAAKVREAAKEIDTSLWYQRYENNGWRPIASKQLHARDDVAHSSAQRRIRGFHHMQQTRKHIAESRRERRKEQWMARMYRGEAHHGADTAVTEPIHEGEEEDAGFEEESKIEKWARALDFESYFDDWLGLATSVSNMHLMRILDDPG
eukprot:CAMPEP_0206252002 /NCGR_PEP_ID=MMETSP0047_2-20121206/22334_1 /ASSEMBLY_ACC=CAM_ASM_000192 /TAXON_ID=195065 /ORGANISM="Chroomonas mesostigmatica_cf, Strain CCMP1168" /LENGTH=289 /DNA_ID=CAMNT_0053678011 /DNA_START=348 /DNA_END=1214 /DNA_ORIENTATION=+